MENFSIGFDQIVLIYVSLYGKTYIQTPQHRAVQAMNEVFILNPELKFNSETVCGNIV